MANPTPPAAPPAAPKLSITKVLWSAFGFALVLAVGFGVPVLPTFLVMGMVVWAGWKASWTAVQLAIRIALGVTIFVTLRFLAAKVLGLYPADTFNTLDNSGGLYWILVGHDISVRVLWEVCFAFVAGQITLDWVAGRSRLVQVFIVLAFVIMTWSYMAKSNPTIENDGLVGAGWKGIKLVLFGKPSPGAEQQTYVPPPPAPARPIAECVTPCRMQVPWSVDIKSDGKPVLVKFFKKTELFRLEGRDSQLVPLEKFNPGEAEFTSPDATDKNIRVQIFKK